MPHPTRVIFIVALFGAIYLAPGHARAQTPTALQPQSELLSVSYGVTREFSRT